MSTDPLGLDAAAAQAHRDRAAREAEAATTEQRWQALLDPARTWLRALDAVMADLATEATRALTRYGIEPTTVLLTGPASHSGPCAWAGRAWCVLQCGGGLSDDALLLSEDGRWLTGMRGRPDTYFTASNVWFSAPTGTDGLVLDPTPAATQITGALADGADDGDDRHRGGYGYVESTRALSLNGTGQAEFGGAGRTPVTFDELLRPVPGRPAPTPPTTPVFVADYVYATVRGDDLTETRSFDIAAGVRGLVAQTGQPSPLPKA